HAGEDHALAAAIQHVTLGEKRALHAPAHVVAAPLYPGAERRVGLERGRGLVHVLLAATGKRGGREAQAREERDGRITHEMSLRRNSTHAADPAPHSDSNYGGAVPREVPHAGVPCRRQTSRNAIKL